MSTYLDYARKARGAAKSAVQFHERTKNEVNPQEFIDLRNRAATRAVSYRGMAIEACSTENEEAEVWLITSPAETGGKQWHRWAS